MNPLILKVFFAIGDFYFSQMEWQKISLASVLGGCYITVTDWDSATCDGFDKNFFWGLMRRGGFSCRSLLC